MPPIVIEYEFRAKNAPALPGGGGAFSVPALASGGIVHSPTLALIGEAEPEAVVMGGVSQQNAIFEITMVTPDGEVLLRQVVKVKKRLGL